MSMTRVGSQSGTSRPSMKPGTMKYAKEMASLSQALLRIDLPWTEDPFLDPSNPDRRMEFAAAIHEKNYFEAARVHLTEAAAGAGGNDDPYDGLLQCHSDIMNSEALPIVCGVTCITNNVRVGMTCYMRKSIDVAFKRAVLMEPLTKHIIDSLDELPPYRKNVTRELVSMCESWVSLPFLKVLCNPCNMDPNAFHQPFLHAALMVASVVPLTLPALLSVVSAMEVIPNSAGYYAAACSIVCCAWRTRPRRWNVGQCRPSPFAVSSRRLTHARRQWSGATRRRASPRPRYLWRHGFCQDAGGSRRAGNSVSCT